MTARGAASVTFAGLTRPEELVAPMPLASVFSRAESVHSISGRTLQHWAGRLAAKRAVLQVLGVGPEEAALRLVEVLPRPSPLCSCGGASLRSHPPEVILRTPLRSRTGTRLRVSISHTCDLAVAVALESAVLPGEP